MALSKKILPVRVQLCVCRFFFHRVVHLTEVVIELGVDRLLFPSISFDSERYHREHDTRERCDHPQKTVEKKPTQHHGNYEQGYAQAYQEEVEVSEFA